MQEYYKDTELYGKVVAERKEVQRIYMEMRRILKLSIGDDNRVMLGYAKAAGINLNSNLNLLRFESAKRSMISKCFNKGNFNRRLLYQCIQEVMLDHEKAADSSDKTDSELAFWKHSLFCSILLAIIVYLTTSQSFLN